MTPLSSEDHSSRRSTLRRSALALVLLVALAGCDDDDPTNPGGDGVGPIDPEGLVELQLTARSLADESLPLNASGEVEVDVGEIFVLELAYADLREGSDATGIFSLAIDLVTDQGDRLEAVLSETQQLVFGSELGAAISNDPTGTIVFGIEGNVATYTTTGTAFADDPLAEIEMAMQTFGYSRGVDYEVRQYSAPGSGGSDSGFRIRWSLPTYANVDAPDLFAQAEFEDPVSTQLQEFSPVGPDGVTLDQAGLRFNVDTSSRTFDGGAEFYTVLGDVEFDTTRGFTDLEVIGRIIPGGIPEASVDAMLVEPFDVLSVPVRLRAPVDGLEIRVAPADRADAILLYGSDGPVIREDVWLDDDSRVVLVGS